MFGNQGVIRLNEAFSPQLGGVKLTFVAALALAVVVHGVLFHTSWGLQLRASGTSEDLVASRGLNSNRLKTTALVLSGVLGALGGAVLSLNLGAWVQGISAGKGWIALVALYLGLRRPLPLMAACLLLAWTQQASGFLQGLPELPQGLLLGLPSLVTVVVFVITSATQRGRQRKSAKPISR